MGGGKQLRVQLRGHRDCEGPGCPTLAQQSQKVTGSPQLMLAMLFHGTATGRMERKDGKQG